MAAPTIKPKVNGAESTKPAAKTTGVKKAQKQAALDALEDKRSPSDVASTPVGPLDGLEIRQSFPIDALGSIKPKSAAGVVFRLDSGFLDALRLVVRRIESKDGAAGFRIEMKIAGPSRDGIQARLEKKGATPAEFAMEGANPVHKNGSVVLKGNGKKQTLSGCGGCHADGKGSNENALRLEGTHWVAEYLPDDTPIGVRGMLRLTLKGSDAQCSTALKDLVQKLGIHDVFAPPTSTSIKRYAMLKLLWVLNPKGAKKVAESTNLSSLKLETIESELKKLGVSKQRINNLRYEEVAPGHFTVVDPALIEEVKEAGLRYAYSTVTTPEHVLSILTHGQKATLTRWAEGALIEGMSSTSDVGSGGAQGVFSRLVVDCGHGDSWNGRTYRLVLRPELLGRLDIWGHNNDMYGQSWGLTDKNFGAKLIKSVGPKKGSYNSSNEIISPVGNSPDYIACVTCEQPSERTKLISYLKKHGYKPSHGKTLEKFVVVAENIKSNLLGGKAPKTDKDDES